MSRFSMRRGMLLAFLLGYAVLLVFGTLIERQVLEEKLIQDETSAVRERLTTLADVAEYSIQTNRLDRTRERIVRMSSVPEIKAAALVDSHGRVILAARQGWMGSDAAKILAGFQAARMSILKTGQLAQIDVAADGNSLKGYQVVKFPAQSGEIRSNRIGFVFIDYDLSRNKQQLWTNLIRQNAVAWGLVLVLLAGLYLAMDRWMSRPMNTILAAMRRFQQGELDVRVPLEGCAELEAMGHGFNLMADEFGATLHAIPDLLLELDEQGTYLSIWSGNEQLLAAQKHDLLGRTVTDMLPPDAAKVVMAALGEAAETGASQGRVICLPLPNGLHWFELSVASKQGQPDTLRRFMVMSRDITERKQAETELREMTAMRQAILDSANFSIIATDTEGLITVFNQGAQRMLGYSMDEVVGKLTPAVIHVPEEVVARARVLSAELGRTVEPGFEAFVAKSRNGLPDENEWTYVRKDGSTFPVLLSVTALFDASGAVTGYLGVGQDITARKQAEAELREMTAMRQAILDSANFSIIATDTEGLITVFNKGAQRLLGYSEEEVVGKLTPAVLHVPAEVVARAAVLSAELGRTIEPGFETCVVKSRGGKPDENEWTHVRKDGSAFPFQLSVTALFDEVGTIYGYLGIGYDLTERKRAEAQQAESMRFAQATLDALSSNVAILDAAGVILATNRAWDEFAAQNDGQAEQVGVGCNYLAVCEPDAVSGTDGIASAIRDIIAGQRETFLFEYPCHSPTEQRWYYCRVTRFTGEGPIRVVVAHENITPLKQVEASLSASKNVFETLAAVSPVGIAQADADGQWTYVNRRWRYLAGSGDALGEGWLAAVHPDERERVRADWRNAMAKGGPSRFEFRLRRSNGNVRWVIADAAPILGKKAQRSGWLITITDVTEHKLTEQALRLMTYDLAKFSGDAFAAQMAMHIADLLDVDTVMICRWHPSHPDKACSIAHVSDGELQPNICYDITGTPCAKVHLNGEYVKSGEGLTHFPDDKMLAEMGMQAFAGVRMVDSTGKAFGHLAVMRRSPFDPHLNMIALLQLFAVAAVSDQERQRGRKRFEDMFELSSDAIILADSRGMITMANRQAEVMFDYTRAELVGQPVEVLMTDDKREARVALRDGFAESTAGHMMGADRPTVLGRRKDGSTIPVEISLTPLESEEGKLVAASIRDISERVRIAAALEKSARELQESNDEIFVERAQLAWRVSERTADLSRANAALVKAGRDKDDFLATMSHEIRTPLNGMLGMLEILGIGDLEHEQKNELSIAMESGRSLMRIIDDILDYSKIQAGKLEILPKPTALSKVVMDVRNAFSANASSKGLVLLAKIDERISPALMFDAFRVTQILKNFVSNAIKFTQQGQVEIRATWLGNEAGAETVRLSVSDTGIGISEDAQQRLFKPYEQVHDEGGRMYGGTGLGLSICQRLVEMMGGKVAVKSIPGEGSTMSVVLTFPVTEIDVSDPIVNPPELSAAALTSGGLPILAADDHPVNRTLLAKQFKALGLPIVLAENGVEALELWRHGHYALVITDCHMPEMDGYTLAAKIREIEAEEGRPRSPIIAWTAKAFAEDIELCTRVGMDDFLAKPASLKVLSQTLTKWLAAAEQSAGQATVHAHEPDAPRPLLDPGALDTITASAEEQSAILLEFVGHTHTDLAALKAALNPSDSPEFTRIAHRIKGASLMVGANELIALSESAEQAGRSGETQAMTALIPDMEAALARLEAYMNVPVSITPERVAQDEIPVFDASVLVDMLGDDPESQRALLNDYLASKQQLVGEILQASDSRDAAELARIAHKLKSSSRAVGAIELGSASEELERAGRNGAWADIDPAFDRFLVALKRLNGELTA